MKHAIVAVVIVTVLTLFSARSVPTSAQQPADIVPGSYIVVLKDTVRDPGEIANEMARAHGLGIAFTYHAALRGFAATVPDARLKQLADDPRVAFISHDRTVSAVAPGGTRGKPPKLTPTPTPPAQSQQTVPGGVTRIGAAGLTNKGNGVTVAVIDTGLDLTHPDLSANIIGGYNCSTGSGYADGNGHGTHVGGTIAAPDNATGVVGVAPSAKLLGVRVLNNAGSGTWSSVICGIDWVTANRAAYDIAVANMSLGGSGTSDNNCGNSNNDALHHAICASANAGITYVVAAGNNGSNAAGFVPAAYHDTVITVSALADSDSLPGGVGSATSYGSDDTFASFSNYGVPPVTVAAPGVDIHSTWKGGGYNTISGTSMASPHVAGAAALYLASHPGAAWTAVRSALVSAGEPAGAGHTDPGGRHPEPVVNVSGF